MVISKPGRIHGTRVAKRKRQLVDPGKVWWWRGMEQWKVKCCCANSSLSSHWDLGCVWVGKCCHLCAAPRLQRRHITSCNYKMPEENRKEKEQLFLLLDMKTNQLRKVLWWAVCDTGCVGWILPHLPKGRGWIIPQVQIQKGAVQKTSQLHILFLITLNYVLLFNVKV